jgi:Fe-S-cluster-containing dehydrogenase component
MNKIRGRLVINELNCRGCLSCQLACSFAKHKKFNPTKSCIVIKRNVENESTKPVVIDGCCDLCGGYPACVEACPYNAIMFEEVGPSYE